MHAARIPTALSILVLAAAAPAQRLDTWFTDVALDLDVRLEACAVGDCDPDADGREIVAVDAEGAVHLLRRARGSDAHEVVHRHAGALRAVAVGDLVRELPGDEIVAAGADPRSDGAGAVLVLVGRDADGRWHGDVIWSTAAPLHALAVVDGAILAAAGDRVLRLASADGAWQAEPLADLGAAGGSIVGAQGTAFAAVADGSVVRLGSSAVPAILDRRPPARASLASDGERLLVARADGALVLLTAAGDGWNAEVLLESAGALTGCALADLDPGRTGLEAAAACPDGIRVLRERNGRWRDQLVHAVDDGVTALAAADLDGRAGDELVACTAGGRVLVLRRGAEALPGPQADDWDAEIALDSGVVTGGCAVGDVLPDRPGDEIVTVARDGRVRVAWRVDGVWRSEVAHHGRGELIQVCTGDLIASIPGHEIVAVGVADGLERDDSPGIATVVFRRDGAWHSETAFAATALQHGACVLDGAAFVTGYDQQVHRLTRGPDGWHAETLGDLPGAGKGAAATPFGVLITCTDGSLARVRSNSGGWAIDVVDVRDSGRSRVGSDGTRVIVSDNDGTLSILEPTEAVPWRRTEIHREFDLLRGAILARLDPHSDATLAATAGYEFKISILREVDGRWWSRLLYRDSDRLHHLAAGDVDGEPGLELVACGYSGRVVVLSPRRGP